MKERQRSSAWLTPDEMEDLKKDGKRALEEGRKYLKELLSARKKEETKSPETVAISKLTNIMPGLPLTQEG